MGLYRRSDERSGCDIDKHGYHQSKNLPITLKNACPNIDPSFDWVDFYLAKGWRIFPLHWIENGSCTCRKGSECRSAGKHPRNQNGFHGATTDLVLIRSWLIRWPRANLGIATGGLESVVIIDVDPRHGGLKSLAELEDRYAMFPQTYTVKTGSGGFHFYFTMCGIDPPIRNSAGYLGAGLDVRGEGGYVVVPPSENQMGEYTVEVNADVAPIPRWVIDLLHAPKRARPTSHSDVSRFTTQGGLTTVGVTPRDLDDAVMEMIRTPEGCRNPTLNFIAFWAGRRIKQGVLDLNEAVDRLTAAAALVGLDNEEIERTLWSGLTAGIEKG